MMKPCIAIIDNNTLEAMGLKNIIDEIIPMADVNVYTSMDELRKEDTRHMVHFFVPAQILIEATDFFLQRVRQTVVLVNQTYVGAQLSHFRTLNTALPEHQLIKAILQLHEVGHGHRTHLGPSHTALFNDDDPTTHPMEISAREAEVLALVVRGLINKEIADRLNISLPTVITHRKNICEKLHLRSVSSLTVYAVTHGIVRIEEI